MNCHTCHLVLSMAFVQIDDSLSKKMLSMDIFINKAVRPRRIISES